MQTRIYSWMAALIVFCLTSCRTTESNSQIMGGYGPNGKSIVDPSNVGEFPALEFSQPTLRVMKDLGYDDRKYCITVYGKDRDDRVAIWRGTRTANGQCRPYGDKHIFAVEKSEGETAIVKGLFGVGVGGLVWILVGELTSQNTIDLCIHPGSDCRRLGTRVPSPVSDVIIGSSRDLCIFTKGRTMCDDLDEFNHIIGRNCQLPPLAQIPRGCNQ